MVEEPERHIHTTQEGEEEWGEEWLSRGEEEEVGALGCNALYDGEAHSMQEVGQDSSSQPVGLWF